MSMLFGFRPIEFLTLLLAGGSALVGLYIAFLAYRGLRRYQSKQMLFLSTGMILLFGAAYALSLFGSLLIHLRILSLPQQDFYRLAVRALQFTGLVSIAYSLYIRE